MTQIRANEAPRGRLWAALAALALMAALVVGASIGRAGAYFTDTTWADGGLDVVVEPTTKIHEWYLEGVKHLVISNDADAKGPVFVRAKVYSSVGYEATGEGWGAADDEGWMHYGPVLDPGTEANELTVTVEFPTVQSDEQPDGAVYGDNFNVIVVYEATPARYAADGSPDPDWTYILDTGGSEGGE